VSDKYHLRKSSRTGVERSYQQNDISFQPNNYSDRLSEGSSQPVSVGTENVRVDKQVSSESVTGNNTNKSERIRRSRKVNFTSNTNLTSISNRHLLNEESKENKSRFKNISIDGKIIPKKKNDRTECESDSSANSHDVMEFDKSYNSSKSTDNIPEASVDDYKYFIGNTHRDDKNKLLYLVTKVYRQRKSGYIVADRVLILSDDSNHKISDHLPTHVRDIEFLTKMFEDENKKLPLRCNLSQLVTNSEGLSSTNNDTNNVIEDIKVTNNSDVMYCNLSHRHSGYD
jgi:hypothetical protein